MTERSGIHKEQFALDKKRQEQADKIRTEFTDHMTGKLIIAEEMLRTVGDAVATKHYATRFPQQIRSRLIRHETKQ